VTNMGTRARASRLEHLRASRLLTVPDACPLGDLLAWADGFQLPTSLAGSPQPEEGPRVGAPGSRPGSLGHRRCEQSRKTRQGRDGQVHRGRLDQAAPAFSAMIAECRFRGRRARRARTARPGPGSWRSRSCP
jgi:hypothetical protein